MEKLKMHTPDLTAEKVRQIAELLPNCVTEAQGVDGTVRQAIDFDQLRQELSDHVVEGPAERYRLDWPGKREAILSANAPIAKTLRPAREESVDFDRTKNLFIEGDNLDALKLLQETYLGKVKLIYIDPPYNTGSDFVYRDAFAQDSETYLVQSNQKDEAGNRLVANTEANGRFHSDWLTMVYSRLKLARNLLRDDGVLMVSIDDHEISRLRLALDEIFGPANWISTFVWKRKAGGGDDSEHAAIEHEYILCYGRRNDAEIFGRISHESPSMTAKYNRVENGHRYYLERLDKTSLTYSEAMDFPIECPDGTTIKPPQPDPNNPTTIWRWSQTKVKQDKSELIFERERKTNEWRIYTKTWMSLDGVTARSLLVEKEHGRNRDGTQDLTEILGPKIFNNPKPLKLLRHLIQIGAADPESIVLDFYSGSATVGHVLMERNALDSGNRRFILVQLPEATNRSDYPTIAEIGKERLRRAGTKIKTETKTSAPGLDAGFRVLKIDTSNMHEVYYTPDQVQQADLHGHVNNTRPDRTPEDLLFQVLLDWGVDLASPVSIESIDSKTVFFVDGNVLVACFDAGVTDDLVKEIAKRKPLRAVFRDTSYGSDSVKINVDQIFRFYSPETEVKAI
jgi:adenine-specific DNA-methyltransferase